jgi:hypothetical protein
MWRFLRIFPVIALMLCMAGAANALVLDWSSATWTPGATSGGIEVDGNNPGDDVMITLSGNLNKLRTDPNSGTATPAILTRFQGGLGSPDHSLHFFVNAGTQTEITVTISFSALYVQGVENVSFSLFDIDKTTDAEMFKNMYATDMNGNQIAATISNLGSGVSLSGTGLTQLLTGNSAAADSGAGSGNGNATVSFGATAIRSFTFTFDNSSGPPRIQEFGLYDINFTPVPEINPAWTGAFSCFVAAGMVLAHRRSVRKKAKESEQP